MILVNKDENISHIYYEDPFIMTEEFMYVMTQYIHWALKVSKKNEECIRNFIEEEIKSAKEKNLFDDNTVKEE